MNKLPLIAAVLSAAALTASAELKIATVDMETVILSHPQSEENKANLVKLQKEFEAERDVKRQKIQDLYKQLETIAKEADNEALSEQERKKKFNTGRDLGRGSLEETAFATNLEATREIARQLRLRNLGGIIIIDFIDMQSEDHRRRVLQSLEQALAKDRAKTGVNGFSQLGLVEMTRKRTRESLEHVLCSQCPECNGRGRVKTVESVCYEILREILRVNRAYDADQFVVYASPAVAEALRGDESHSLAELEVFISKQVKVQAEPLYSQEQFDVVMM